MRPSFIPVGDCKTETHHFSEDEEPKNMLPGAAWSKARAQPSAEDRDQNKKTRTGYQSGAGRNFSWVEFARKHPGKQWIRTKNQHHRQQITSSHHSKGL